MLLPLRFLIVLLASTWAPGALVAGEEPPPSEAPGSKPPQETATHEVKEQPLRIEVALKGVFLSRDAREVAVHPEANSVSAAK